MRPEGFKNPHETVYKPGENSAVDVAEGIAYEAGADAYEAAIWKMAKESPTGTFTIDSNITQVYARIYDLPEEAE